MIRTFRHIATIVLIFSVTSSSAQIGLLPKLFKAKPRPPISATFKAAEEASRARIAAKELELTMADRSLRPESLPYGPKSLPRSENSSPRRSKPTNVLYTHSHIRGVVVENRSDELKTVKNFDVYVSIPKDANEFKNIFKTPNQRQLMTIKPIYKSIVDDKDKNVFLTASASKFLNKISISMHGKPIVLIGHNKGGLFYFPDGSSTPFSKMDSVAKASGKIIIFLSCNATEYTESPSVSHFITYNEAFSITNWLDRYDYDNRGQARLKNDLQDILDAYAKRRIIIINLKVFCVGAALVGAGYGVYVVDRK